jgi:undecaprenyl-phosphate 4-deoxy-4-formamido-L-arabinose transferase
MGFSVVPLRLAMYLGYFFAGIGFLGAIWVIIRKIVRPVTAIGWPSMMMAICFFSGIILVFMGLIIERTESSAPLRMNISAGSFCVEGSQKIVYM